MNEIRHLLALAANIDKQLDITLQSISQQLGEIPSFTDLRVVVADLISYIEKKRIDDLNKDVTETIISNTKVNVRAAVEENGLLWVEKNYDDDFLASKPPAIRKAICETLQDLWKNLPRKYVAIIENGGTIDTDFEEIQ